MSTLLWCLLGAALLAAGLVVEVREQRKRLRALAVQRALQQMSPNLQVMADVMRRLPVIMAQAAKAIEGFMTAYLAAIAKVKGEA